MVRVQVRNIPKTNHRKSIMPACIGSRCPALTSKTATELALSAQAGNADAFNQLSIGCLKLFRAWAITKIGGKMSSRSSTQQSVDEMVSEASVSLVRAVRTYKAGTKTPFLGYLRSWVTTSWNHTYFQQMRRKSREMSILENRIEIIEDGDRDQEGAKKLVEEILGKMPESQASLIRMVYGIGEGNKEPQKIKDLERRHGFGRNTLHERLKKAKEQFRTLVDAA